MQVTTSQLNQVAEFLGTTDKNVVFSAVIKTLVEAGMPVREAYEAVFGEGSWKQMAGEVWEALRAKSAQRA